jgi:competence protein ComFC
MGLEALIYAYKFGRSRAGYVAAADMFDTALPQLPQDCIVTAVPTIAAHIRQRGYDHTALIAQEFARRRGLPFRSLLVRTDNTRQQGASKKQRFAQARSAFACVTAKPAIHLLIDDVFTTGATAQYAALRLREAGATEVWLAVLARQPLEK